VFAVAASYETQLNVLQKILHVREVNRGIVRYDGVQEAVYTPLPSDLSERCFWFSRTAKQRARNRVVAIERAKQSEESMYRAIQTHDFDKVRESHCN
jgi:hypothetical protein